MSSNKPFGGCESFRQVYSKKLDFVFTVSVGISEEVPLIMCDECDVMTGCVTLLCLRGR